MPDYPDEPGVLRLARAAASILPMGRSTLVRGIGNLCRANRPFIATIAGRRFPVDLSERVSRTLYLYGQFEPATTTLIRRIICSGDRVIDAGANFGYFTLIAAEAVGPGGKVYAFEPDPRNIERLETVLNANHLTNVEIVPKGVFDREGSIDLFLAATSEDNLGASSIVAGSPGRERVSIPITTLATFTRDRGIEAIDLLKMDIEGAEFEALAGARPLLAAHAIRKLLIEMHVNVLGEDKLTKIVEELSQAGYHGYLLREDRERTGPLSESLVPLSGAWWGKQLNPHCLFCVEPITS